ncbi:MAG: phenylalanine--tRNA ligase subunit beta, partial [Candidatus Nanoarchaeia archaeon]|nr:phenylalanine--tRNA ligase subunit beta [Candidatus Nanoarchaeia archaeon]
IGASRGLKEYKVNNSNYKFKFDKKAEKVRPCVAQAVIKDIKITEDFLNSIMQLQEKLHVTHGRKRKKVSMGVYDLDKIQFPLTYTTKPLDFKFQPLDAKYEMTLHEILESHPKGVEFAHLLEGFNELPVWIDANNQILSMPPVINSEPTKVTAKTKNLFIDSTGTDQKAVELALNILVTACADHGGKIYKVNNYPNLTPSKMKLDLKYINKLTGLDIKNPKPLLDKMGLGFKNNEVLIPSYRSDILSQVDLAEEIAIAYGYDNIKEEIPQISTIGEESKLEIFKNKIANILVGLNLLETNTYHLINKELQTNFMNINPKVVEIKNSMSKEYDSLRYWMIPSLMQVLKNNKHRESPQNIFEIGRVFTGKEEITRLAVLISHPTAGYTEVKQVLDALELALGLKFNLKETEHNSFIPGRVARVSCKNIDLAYIGEIHPQVLSNFELEMPIAALELNLTELFKLL